MTGSNINITSMNCQGLQDLKKHAYVLKYLKDLDSEIYCLQDTHWLTEHKKFIKIMWQGECFLNRQKSRGVAIMLKRNFEYKANSIKVDNRSFISVLLTINDLRFHLINIYAPNSDSPDLISYMYIKGEAEVSALVGSWFDFIHLL